MDTGFLRRDFLKQAALAAGAAVTYQAGAADAVRQPEGEGIGTETPTKTILFLDDWLVWDRTGLVRTWLMPEPWPNVKPAHDPNLGWSFAGMSVVYDRQLGKWFMWAAGSVRSVCELTEIKHYAYVSDDGIQWKPRVLRGSSAQGGPVKPEQYSIGLEADIDTSGPASSICATPIRIEGTRCWSMTRRR